MDAIASGRTDLMRVKRLILESALVYTVIVIPTVVTLFARSAAYYSFASVVSLAYTWCDVVLIRVYLHHSSPKRRAYPSILSQ
ncbi:uncharacterized protein LAESUDRAFT_723314 [Laetiporus sulphureus 93-53]|uniref:Uncharacterized protein n=1 Tax=Laetiporus sulphureus 93-53 TaxID=1314785 RepID=A0A165FI61_9APHY|nr:uncharacterized protein LAESUDRAFT_723314 [Laetiporus sulphureus 93-53]KZT09007.1 hypothetical protein LAESUDRAFT_723314 [Laetiporus sulphureus 93-53]